MRRLPIDDLTRIAGESNKFLQDFSDARILLTGASGFVGSWIFQTLIHLNHYSELNAEIDVTTRNPDQINGYLDLVCGEKLRPNVIKCNLGSGEFSVKTKGKKYDLVIHGATPASTLANNAKYQDLYSASVDGLLEIINSGLQSTGKTVVLHLSSGAIYGHEARLERSISENQGPALVVTNLDPYARTKIETENLLIKANSEGLLLGANPRLFAFAGPGIPINKKFAIGNFISDAISGRKIQLTGSPETRRSYMYPSDLVQALFSVSLNPSLEVTHIGSNESLSMLEIAREINDVFSGKGIEFLHNTALPNYYVPETDQTLRRIGFQPHISFKSSVRKWHDWLYE